MARKPAAPTQQAGPKIPPDQLGVKVTLNSHGRGLTNNFELGGQVVT